MADTVTIGKTYGEAYANVLSNVLSTGLLLSCILLTRHIHIVLT